MNRYKKKCKEIYKSNLRTAYVRIKQLNEELDKLKERNKGLYKRCKL